MDLFDAGSSTDQIVAQTGIRRELVQQYISNYHGGPSRADAKWRNDLISASFALLERVTAVHGRHPA